ncbi:MAG TPA: DUF1259 domain-containing protein [Gemmatimonadaceae bacterium]|nr:DUF1259 domain-containing protein [Gemmatimonadaceae bacterium]
MNTIPRICARVVVTACLVMVFPDTAAAQAASSRFWKPVEDALGRKGTPNPGSVLKFSFPRSDLRVVLRGVVLKPSLALNAWVAFQRIGDHVTMMGDLVLLDSEVASVLGSLQQNGVEQTAVHNHLLNESPRVVYMHIRAIGNGGRIARAVRTALEFTQTPLGPPAAPAPAALAPVVQPGAPAAPPVPELDVEAIARIIGVRGKMNAGVYQLSIPRREKIVEEKKEIPPAMGIATSINFQPTAMGKAAVTGDFVLLGREVNPVIWTLIESGIEVTAIHSHMLNEQPRLFFLHFWASDDVSKIARGLKTALERTKSRR